MRHFFSTTGLVLGFLAIAVAVFDAQARPEPPKGNQRGTVEIAAGNRTLTVKLRGDEPPAPPPKPFRPLRAAYTLLGLAAMGLGTFSWIKREHVRMSGGAAALGLMAVCWQWVALGVCVAIVIFVLANLSL